MKHLLASLVALSALVAGCALAPATTPSPSPASFDIVTLNIYHDRADWPKRMPLVIEGLRAIGPDVIVLQEVLQHEALPNQAQSIGDALGYTVHFTSIDPPGKARRYGNAILTRRPVLASSGRALQPPEDSRNVAHVRIDIDGTPVNIYGTHLHHTAEGGAMREAQLREVLAHVGATAGDAPVVLAGDFNALATLPELAALSPRFVDAYARVHPDADALPDRSTTLNPAFFDTDRRRIDHVFIEPEHFEVVEARRVLDAPGTDGTWPTDHFGVHVRLRLRP